MNLDVETIIREYIDKTVHMSLATVSGDAPWVCEVHFAYDENLSLYFVSLPTTRHCRELAVNPRVAGNIIKQHSLEEAPNGIYFEGSAEVITEPSDKEIEIYCSRLNRDQNELRGRLQADNGHRVYKIRVSNWAAFGKFGLESNQKHELSWNGGSK